jgi:hypothetical protein
MPQSNKYMFKQGARSGYGVTYLFEQDALGHVTEQWILVQAGHHETIVQSNGYFFFYTGLNEIVLQSNRFLFRQGAGWPCYRVIDTYYNRALRDHVTE